jgi:hypothetical protein
MLELLFVFFLFFLVFGTLAAIADSIHFWDNELQRYYREHQRRAAIDAYHVELQRHLAINKTKVELMETETKLKTLQTD